MASALKLGLFTTEGDWPASKKRIQELSARSACQHPNDILTGDNPDDLALFDDG
jgi:hypothetical protein